MATDDLCLLDLVEVGRRVQTGKLSSVEVTRALLDRIARHDSRLKSYATLTVDLALAQAKQADTEIAHDEIRGPLQRTGTMRSHAIFGGLHHYYVRV